MTGELRLRLTVLLLAGALGCASQDSSEGQKPPFEKVRPTGTPEPVAGTELTPRTGQPKLNDSYYIAQGIYLRGLDLLDQKEYDLADLEFGRALNVYPDYYKAWHKRGLCASYKRKYELEITCYRRALEIQPDYMEGLVSLGAAYLCIDELEKAVPVYRKILTIDPNHEVATYNLGIIYFDLQDYHSSCEFLRRFIEKHPQDPYRGRAELLLSRAEDKLRAQPQR